MEKIMPLLIRVNIEDNASIILRKIRDEVKKLGGKPVTVKVSIDDQASAVIERNRIELEKLGRMQVNPKVELDTNMEKEIQESEKKALGFLGKVEHYGGRLKKIYSEVAGELGGIGATLTGLVVGGATVKDLINESKAESWQIAIHGAQNAHLSSKEYTYEMEQYQKGLAEVKKMYQHFAPGQAASFVDFSRQLFDKNSNQYAVKAAQIAETNGQDPKEILKMMASLQSSTGVSSADRLADSIQYMFSYGKDMNGELISSIVKNSSFTSEVFNKPEQIALFVESMGKLNLSPGEGFSALKTSVQTLNNKGDLEQILIKKYEADGKTKEEAIKKAKEVTIKLDKAQHTEGYEDDDRLAMAEVLTTIASMKDPNVLKEVGGKEGQLLQDKLAPIYQEIGSIAQKNPENMKGLTNKANEKYQELNGYDALTKAQNEAKDSLSKLAEVVAKDLTPILTGLSNAVQGVANFFSAHPWMRYGAEAAVAAGAFGIVGFKAKKIVSSWKGEEGSNKDSTSPNDQDKGKKKSPSGNKKNQKPSKDTKPSKNNKQSKKPQTAGGGKNISPKPKESVLSKLKTSMSGAGETVGNLFGKAKDFLPSWKTIKTFGKRAAKRLPLVGTAIGASSLLTSDNKMDTLLRLGAETGGGALGGAVAGAAIGSVVPVFGTAIGGVVGGILGSIGGGYLYDKAKGWWTGKSEQNQPAFRGSVDTTRSVPKLQADQAGQPIKPVATAKPTKEQNKLTSLTVQSMPITLKADGVLQDVSGMMRLLRDPSIGNEIKRIIEKAFVDAYETKGGVARGGVIA